MNIPYLLFKKITNNFADDRIIGRGGFGNVYKGVLDNGELTAVKMLHPLHGLDDGLFKNEVCNNLFKVDHPNIIGLLGYCDEIHSEFVEYKGENVSSKHVYRGLCFEYFPDGSLQKHLEEQSLAPDWSTRYNIIKGICKGLNFLHGLENPIYHLDLKPANILFDSSMVPKLADFGLSRLFAESQTHVTQRTIGTDKYVPPEYRSGGTISSKNDVYSFGVVMIEIMEGYSPYQEMKVTQFKQEVLSKWNDMIEPKSEYREVILCQVEMCIDIAIHCVDSERKNRPTIASILNTLKKTETGIPKTQPVVLPQCPKIDLENSLAKTVKMLRAELDNITNSVPNIEQVRDTMIASSNVEYQIIIRRTEKRETSSNVDEELIIGRAKEKKEILYILSENSTSKMVILPIYGIGGIGKTTLAQLVYNDTQFRGYSRVWIYVSENFDLKKIGNSIISVLTNEISDVANLEMLNNRLGILLSGKSILIVLDDLWENDPDELHKLKVMLRLGQGSKVIIVTTRDQLIARMICSTAKNVPYKLEILTDDMCWAIIKKKCDLENQAGKKSLEQIGRGIAIKCGGVALAAQSLGYLLMSMCTSDQWESVKNSDIWNSSDSEDTSLQTHKVLSSLWLSYSHMPRWLQSCFTYCAVFPKGHNIVKYDLIYQWIALELIEPSKIFDSMQLCEQYITHLLGLSFLQYSVAPSDERKDEYTTFFTMHDLVHDLARSIWADKGNKNGNVLGSNYQYAFLTDPSKQLTCPENIKALHLDSYNRIKLRDGTFSPAKNLLVLELKSVFSTRKLPSSIGKLKQLRYLHAPWIRDRRIPKCLSQLLKLNYLNLRLSRMKALPDSIGDMKDLMYVDLSDCEELGELPVSFTNLKQLVHLDLSNCPVPISESWGSFTKLQYLNLSSRSQMNHFFPKQKKYQDFNVLAEVIGKLTKLQYLNLSFCTLPNYTKWLPEPDVFAKLIQLRYLYLGGCMSILPYADIHSLLVGICTLYNLEHLDLSHCERLKSIPEGIGNLTTLHTLDISCCNIQKLPAWMAKMASLKIINMTTLDECGGNLILFAATNPRNLRISKLEDVKSLEEAESIKLIEKRIMDELKLEWTVGCHNRSVEDKDVLEILVPPNTITRLKITGYVSLSFPTNWLMGIGQYLCNVERIILQDLPKCNSLPPLGKLPNLERLSLLNLGCLEELNTADSCGELMFPKLNILHIRSCPKLKLKPCLPRAVSTLWIEASDNMLISWGECSSRLINLAVMGTTVPLYHWSLLQHVSALRAFIVGDCSDLVSCSPEVIQRLSSLKSLELKDDIQTELPTWLLELTSLQRLTIRLPKLEKLNDNIRQLTRLHYLKVECRSMTSLPQGLGELTSLKELKITECKGIRSLPGSIRQLTKLETLEIESYVLYHYEIEIMFSSISANTDEVDIHKIIEPRHLVRYPNPRKLGVMHTRQLISATSSSGSLNALVSSFSAISIYSARERLSDLVNTWTHENVAHIYDAGVRPTSTHEIRHRRHILPSSSVTTTNSQDNSSGIKLNKGVVDALMPKDEVDVKDLVSSLSTISIDSGFTFSATKRLSDPPANAVKTSTHDNLVHNHRGGVRHTWTRRPRQGVIADSAAATNSLDTPSGSTVNNNSTAADAPIIPTNVVADAADTSVEDIIRSFFALSNEPDSATWLDM